MKLKLLSLVIAAFSVFSNLALSIPSSSKLIEEIDKDEILNLDEQNEEQSQSYIPRPLKACYQNPAFCAAGVLTTLAVAGGIYFGHQSLASPSETLALDTHSTNTAKSNTLENIFSGVWKKQDGGVRFSRSCSTGHCNHLTAEKNGATAEAVHKVRSCPNFEPNNHDLSQTANHQASDSISSYDGQLDYLLGDIN